MPYRPDPIPEDIAELIELCRSGKLFAVQEWISAGKRIAPPPGRYSMTPLKAVLRSGFHSMLEVFLRAGLEQDERDKLLMWAVSHGKPDFVDLLHRYGADLSTVPVQTVLDSRDPQIMRIFVEHGADMETRRPILYAFKQGNRGFLGIYLDLRDKLPSARLQADMALRYHCRNGSLKWVCLLMWAGANPRACVPDPEFEEDDEPRTPLADAIAYGHLEIVKKIGIDPGQDDLAGALADCLTPNAALVRLVLDTGVDLSGEPERSPMDSMIHRLCPTIDPTWPIRDSPQEALKCIRLLAETGVRWQPTRDTKSFLRQSISRASSAAFPYLRDLLETGGVGHDAFRELMKTDRMREVLGHNGPVVERLRQTAGWKPVCRKAVKPRRRRASRREST